VRGPDDDLITEKGADLYPAAQAWELRVRDAQRAMEAGIAPVVAEAELDGRRAAGEAMRAAYRAGRLAAAEAVEAAMRSESDRLAGTGLQRIGVERGLGVAKAIPAVVAAARGEG
jgi:hypothetical protein